MFEIFTIPLIYNFLKDLICLVFRRRRKLTVEQKIKLRKKCKNKISDPETKNRLLGKVIIRDVRRDSKYPHKDYKSRGISPVFRVDFMKTYHNGIVVGLDWHRLIEEEDGTWRRMDDNEESKKCVSVIYAGHIPYENIENIDLMGDECFDSPHIYCHFSNRKKPYESFSYYIRTQRLANSDLHFEQLSIDFKQVKRRVK